MKKIIKFSAIAMFLLANIAYAQSDTTAWGRNSCFNKMYDPKTVTEIKGEITKIESMVPMNGMSNGIHITIKGKDQNYSVHLGPKWYLDNQAIKLREKDNVSVKGSKVTFAGAPAIIAMEVTKGSEILKLRDSNGFPVWSGGGRR